MEWVIDVVVPLLSAGIGGVLGGGVVATVVNRRMARAADLENRDLDNLGQLAKGLPRLRTEYRRYSDAKRVARGRATKQLKDAEATFDGLVGVCAFQDVTDLSRAYRDVAHEYYSPNENVNQQAEQRAYDALQDAITAKIADSR